MFSRITAPKLRIDRQLWQPKGSPDSFEVTLRRSSLSRHVRILVARDGRITVTGPLRASKKFLWEVFESKESWVNEQLSKLEKAGHLGKGEEKKEEYKKHKEAARALVHEKLAYWNQFYGFTYGRVSIRNQRTRWGSCSARGNLSFSYKIALLPQELADYLIVHELCHLKAFDHSPTFWSLVGEAIPDYAKHRQKLRKSPL
jgi:predicted metal-dependent hydrolase